MRGLKLLTGCCNLPFRVKLVFILIVFNYSCVTIVNSNGISGSKTCAVLRSSENGLRNQLLTIRDGSVFGNIPDEYANATQSWNASGYWTVSPGCELTACESVYLADQCSKFGSNTSPTTQWKSAKCKCNTNCSLHLQRTICGRAYLGPVPGCDVPYIELEGSNPSFPDVGVDKIGSFVVRTGCTINLYEEEDHEEDAEVIEGPLVQNWSGTIGSYECQCNEVESPQTAQDEVSTLTEHPFQLEVPDSLDDIVSQLRLYNYDHPALQAAFSSLTHGRSPTNAYILLIGSTGAGKSSIINNLLNNHNITLAGEDKSTTSQILEFHIPVPVGGIGVLNSQLRIIDTPGLADSRGIENDAVFLATLDEYLLNPHWL